MPAPRGTTPRVRAATWKRAAWTRVLSGARASKFGRSRPARRRRRARGTARVTARRCRKAPRRPGLAARGEHSVAGLGLRVRALGDGAGPDLCACSERGTLGRAVARSSPDRGGAKNVRCGAAAGVMTAGAEPARWGDHGGPFGGGPGALEGARRSDAGSWPRSRAARAVRRVGGAGRGRASIEPGPPVTPPRRGARRRPAREARGPAAPRPRGTEGAAPRPAPPRVAPAVVSAAMPAGRGMPRAGPCRWRRAREAGSGWRAQARPKARRSAERRGPFRGPSARPRSGFRPPRRRPRHPRVRSRCQGSRPGSARPEAASVGGVRDPGLDRHLPHGGPRGVARGAHGPHAAAPWPGSRPGYPRASQGRAAHVLGPGRLRNGRAPPAAPVRHGPRPRARRSPRRPASRARARAEAPSAPPPASGGRAPRAAPRRLCR